VTVVTSRFGGYTRYALAEVTLAAIDASATDPPRGRCHNERIPEIPPKYSSAALTSSRVPADKQAR
jgi:hypothetical protein